jgi:hypothetical protein
MIAFLSLLLHVVVSPFRTKARLEAEIILLRHQLNVLRRRAFLRTRNWRSPTDWSLPGSIVCSRRC